MKYKIVYMGSYGDREIGCGYWKSDEKGIMYCMEVSQPPQNWGFIPHSKLIAILINTDESPTSETTA